mmetsp:Transcript_21026/g.57952  ORF Transcript_21026/g.57952 Transcript_21026/m.57952 type:complete len:354 (+) Transcript_21026:49-1110(+)
MGKPVVCLVLTLSLQAIAYAQVTPILQLKFDEGQGANVFKDSSGNGNDGYCRMSGASCPTAGTPGKVTNAAFFASSCPRAYGSSGDECDYSGRSHSISNLSPGQKTDCYFSRTKMMEWQRKQYSLAASCGSAVTFNPVSFKDGTVMLWYKEAGLNDGNPVQLLNPLVNHAVNPTDATVIRSPADFGWDVSLVGGSDFFLGRLGSNYWGGYWCGKWHVQQPAGTVGSQLSPGYASGDPTRGWDQLAWHHVAYVFAGDSVLVYLDGNQVLMMSGVGSCPKQASFVGKRTQRYTGQEAVRAVVGPGSLPNPTTAHNPDNLRDKEWSTNYFKGYIDDVRIYPAPLDRNTIAAAMSGQ